MKTRISRAAEPLAAVLACIIFSAASLTAQAAAAAPTALSLDDAITMALAKDPGVIAANLDYLSAEASAQSAKWKRLPSISAGAGASFFSPLYYITPPSGYSFLEKVPDADLNLSFLEPGLDYNLTPADHYVSLGLNLSYPVYDGDRTKQSIAVAGLQADLKGVSKETVKRSLAFDVTRAYWEAVRAGYNVSTLQKNLELMKLNADLASRQLSQGVATQADQLAAQIRLQQATEDLADAQTMQRNAYLRLASLTGMDLPSLGISTASLDAPLPFSLSGKPEEASVAAAGAALPLDEAALVKAALERRPETKTAQIAQELAEHSLAISKAALLPTVALTGGLTVAAPNQRDEYDTNKWVATANGSVGLQLSYDIGGIPAARENIKAQTLAASKAGSDVDRQRQAITMDVESCILTLERAERDLELTRSMVAQAEENLRVMQGRIAAGSAKDLDLSSTQFDLLRTNFAVTNKQIDVIVAQADLDRATAARDFK